MIGVIDYGMGNVCSIVNMFKKIGTPVTLVNNVAELDKADKLILPGVGAFDVGMRRLAENGLMDAIKSHVIIQKKPLLGICLGMQMLGRKSEEGVERGLNLIPFDNRRFSFNHNDTLKIPHMGWDIVDTTWKNDNLVEGLSSMQRYYFVHSYHAVCDFEDNVLMRCNYGYSFVAAVKKGNIYGVQFHPEKSHQFGMALLDNFSRGV